MGAGVLLMPLLVSAVQRRRRCGLERGRRGSSELPEEDAEAVGGTPERREAS